MGAYSTALISTIIISADHPSPNNPDARRTADISFQDLPTPMSASQGPQTAKRGRQDSGDGKNDCMYAEYLSPLILS